MAFALETSRIGAWDLDLQNHIAHRTLLHDQIFGYPELLPHWTYEMFLEHVLPEDRPAVAEKFQTAITAYANWSVECRIRRADGVVRWIAATGGHEYSREGKPVRMSGIVQDITDRKLAEQALHASTLELQHKNAELERFLYAASHDLKSPVVTVRTFLGYLEQDMATADTERVVKDINFIRTATDKMARLLDDLLEISRIGRLVGLPVRVTLRTLVDDARGAVAGRIAARGVTVTVDDQDMTLNGDRARLGEVFQNLIDNACKFMGDQPEPRIEIGVMEKWSDGELASSSPPVLQSATSPVFFVRDNGMGIDPRHRSRVFNLFEKLDPKAEGTGIGLALVKRIVELYGGRIWVESAGLGQGACFYFTLPGAVQKNEDGRPKTEDGRPKTEDGRAKNEEGRVKAENERAKTEDRSQKPEGENT